jgi:carbamoyl-phosphate synthase large subunit
MKKPINILFLGGAKRVSLAEQFLEYGRRRNYAISIFSYELDRRVPISVVGKVIVGLKWKDSKLYDHLHEVILENEINIVLPFVDPAIEVACKLRSRYPQVFIPCSDLDLCRTMFDKIKSSEWFSNQQIDQPKSFRDKDKLEFPVIMKPRMGSASQGIQVLRSQAEFNKLHPGSDYLVQAYVEDNTEYSVDCYVAADGKILSIVPRIRIETAGGEVVKSQTIRNRDLVNLSEKILRSGSFRGPITIQFIKDNKTGKVFVMEINPRLGGGVVLSIGAGSGTISFIINEFLGKKSKKVLNWKEGTVITRYFKEVFFYADNH